VAQIVVIDDERSMREFLKILLERDGHTVVCVGAVQSAIAAFCERLPDLVFSDLRLPDGSGMDVLKWLREHHPDVQVIMMTAFASAENAVEAMRLGAYDYQIKPFKVGEVQALTQKALEKVTLIRDNLALRAELKTRQDASRILGRAPRMVELLALIDKVAPTKANVLIEGESGTGKELVARAIHEGSPRAQEAFVAVNCGAIPEALIEAELFGHTAGAFTGAAKARPGLFETAAGGTLFLDEVSSLPQAMQVKLLRALQERSVRRVGDEHERPTDVRLVAATNQSLQQLVQEGSFRDDLYYRLNVVRILVPPLRERTEDIPLLARAFVAKYAQETGKAVEEISSQALRALASFAFPGNVRELENYIERAVTLASSSRIELADLPAEVHGSGAAASNDLLAFPEEGVALEPTLQAIERRFLIEAMRRAGGVKTRAAELLGLSFRSLRYRLHKLGMGEPGGDIEGDPAAVEEVE
jgi:two-component system, NtrC family, response regulator PilR